MVLAFRVQLDDVQLGVYSELWMLGAAPPYELRFVGLSSERAAEGALARWHKWSETAAVSVELSSSLTQERLAKYTVDGLRELRPSSDDGGSLAVVVENLSGLSEDALSLWRWFTVGHGDGWRAIPRSRWPLLLELVRRHSAYDDRSEPRSEPYRVVLPEGAGEAGFYLALGEALRGPGGYYGAWLDALADCTCGGFGPVPPFVVELRGLEGDIAAMKGQLDMLRERCVEVIIHAAHG